MKASVARGDQRPCTAPFTDLESRACRARAGDSTLATLEASASASGAALGPRGVARVLLFGLLEMDFRECQGL